MRSREDRGAILILDDRIVRKKYGAYLRKSLPPAPIEEGAMDRPDPVPEGVLCLTSFNSFPITPLAPCGLVVRP